MTPFRRSGRARYVARATTAFVSTDRLRTRSPQVTGHHASQTSLPMVCPRVPAATGIQFSGFVRQTVVSRLPIEPRK